MVHAKKQRLAKRLIYSDTSSSNTEENQENKLDDGKESSQEDEKKEKGLSLRNVKFKPTKKVEETKTASSSMRKKDKVQVLPHSEENYCSEDEKEDDIVEKNKSKPVTKSLLEKIKSSTKRKVEEIQPSTSNLDEKLSEDEEEEQENEKKEEEKVQVFQIKSKSSKQTLDVRHRLRIKPIAPTKKNSPLKNTIAANSSKLLKLSGKPKIGYAMAETKKNISTKEMIICALSSLKDRKGSSIPAIKKYITINFDASDRRLQLIGKILHDVDKEGWLVRMAGTGASIGSRFKLPSKHPKKIYVTNSEEEPETGTSKKIKIDKKMVVKPKVYKEKAATKRKTPIEKVQPKVSRKIA